MVKIRLARHGAKKRPYYRVVVADSRSPRDGRFIEEVGRYNPLVEPKVIDLDLAEIDSWTKKGAQMSDTVSQLVRIARERQAEQPKVTEETTKAEQPKEAAQPEQAEQPEEPKEPEQAAQAEAEDAGGSTHDVAAESAPETPGEDEAEGTPEPEGEGA